MSVFWIQTFTGRKFDLLDPTPDMVDVRDVAHALSLACRFAGHCRRFYSVAEHSVRVSLMVPPPDALAGLMHDAAEAYIGDVSRPMKQAMRRLCPTDNPLDVMEERIEAVVQRKFGFSMKPASVAAADMQALAAESAELFVDGPRDWQETKGETFRFEDAARLGWSPAVAERAFLDRFAFLSTDH